MDNLLFKVLGSKEIPWNGNFSEIIVPVDQLKTALPKKFQPDSFYDIKVRLKTSGPRWRNRKKAFHLAGKWEEIEIFQEEILPRLSEDGWATISF